MVHYISPYLFRNGDLQTILPTLLRRTPSVDYLRARIDTDDDDFLDLDWLLREKNERIAIISHGLEGSSNGHYVRGLARSFFVAGWSVCAWNYRGCGGSPNLHPYSYHSGKSEDLSTVIDYIRQEYQPREIALIGCSVGGNITLKYLAERGNSAPTEISGAAVYSTPLDLEACAEVMARRRNKIYMNRFLGYLYKKAILKARMFPDVISIDGFDQLKNFHDYDNRYTAPLNGYRDAHHYWSTNSSLPLLPDIRVPVYLLCAQDDPLLSPICSSSELSRLNRHIVTSFPQHGGHVGFIGDYGLKRYWFESQALEFLSNQKPIMEGVASEPQAVYNG